ncbi:MAG: ATP-binding protein [Robiginitomaculum sp.]|nr:ATP-binding protein [Robiginitomaculum sp.]
MTTTQIDSELVEALPDPVLVFKSADLTLAWMNSAAESWLQCSLASKIGSNLAHIAGGFAALETAAGDTAKNGSTIRGHNLDVYIPGAGSAEVSYLIFPYKQNIAILLSPQRYGVGTDNDSDKGQAVGMFGQMLAHELKNPLAGIYGAVQLLEAGISDAADLEITGLIKSEVKRIGRLADKMEDFSISEPSEFDNFNIHTVLRKALLLFQNANNADIKFVENYDPSLPDVYGNADKLMQVVINFLANATDSVKAHMGAGTIEIQTLYRAGVRKQAPQGGLHALPIEVKIIDNGGGVSDKIKDRIFQPFVTGKANGHGLGLALVSKIIEEHGGIVACHSNDDETIFSMLLPSGCKEKV